MTNSCQDPQKPCQNLDKNRDKQPCHDQGGEGQDICQEIEPINQQIVCGRTNLVMNKIILQQKSALGEERSCRVLCSAKIIFPQ